MRAPQRHHVGHIEDFDHGEIRIMNVGGRELGIVRWHDRVFAVRNVCPHVAGPACGSVRPALGGTPQQTPVGDADRPVLVCGWHKWEFDLVTGVALWDPALKVKHYPTDVDPTGAITVTLPTSRGRDVTEGETGPSRIAR